MLNVAHLWSRELRPYIAELNPVDLQYANTGTICALFVLLLYFGAVASYAPFLTCSFRLP
jgi:hypothetical protein